MSPSPTPVSPEPPGTPQKTACEFAQFVTDAEGVVERCRILGTESIWGESCRIIGRDLLELLRDTQPRWRPLLPATLGEGPDNIFLPSPHDPLPSFGFRLHP